MQTSQPGLSGALFAKRSAAKKRERKTEKAAQKNKYLPFDEVKKQQNIFKKLNQNIEKILLHHFQNMMTLYNSYTVHFYQIHYQNQI